MKNCIKHHGILGQKWGVRRFKKSDGSYTEVGRKRYSRKSSEQKESEKQKKKDEKNRGALTTKQLQEKIQRLQMEKQLKELTESELRPGLKAAKQALASIGTNVVNKVATTVLTGATLYGMKALVSHQFDAKKLGEAIFNGGAKKK